MAISDIAKHLQLNYTAIRRKAKELGLKKQKTTFNWTDKQIEWLKENYFLFSCAKLAEHIGCSETSIQTQAKKLNLKKPKNFVPKDRVVIKSERDKEIDNFIKEN